MLFAEQANTPGFKTSSGPEIACRVNKTAFCVGFDEALALNDIGCLSSSVYFLELQKIMHCFKFKYLCNKYFKNKAYDIVLTFCAQLLKHQMMLMTQKDLCLIALHLIL